MSFKTILWWVFSFIYFILVCVPVGAILYLTLESLYFFTYILRALKKTIKNDKAQH